MNPKSQTSGLDLFHPAVRDWFTASFPSPTSPQRLGWPAIARGESTLVLAHTGSGKTLAAFLWAIDRLMFAPAPPKPERCRILYVSPLKALAVDVERNLRAPLIGIAQVAATRGDAHALPAVAIRTGDTPANERSRFQREPADILITTPESLYLLLTSNARERLRSIETVIVDEIHAMVATKRGAHLALSLERLEALCRRPPQRIGLSATQHPLEEVARFLGGVGSVGAQPPVGAGLQRRPATAEEEIHDEFALEQRSIRYRPVTVVDVGERKQLSLRIEVPVQDMAKLTKPIEIPSGPVSHGPVSPSIWASIHPRLLDLIRQHRSTLLFVNSRRLAERLAAALNELAGETIVRSHHGSIARPQRLEIEDHLKAGRIPALVATSSLELGIDMGAIDLVIQIEAPPSVASGMQRIGRGGHQVNAVSRGVIFPKFRGDLVACAAVAEAMHAGHVEATRFPRNPLDVLAQQVVAMVAMDRWKVDDLYRAVRGAAPFAGLRRGVFEGVLDMLSGRHPSDEFATLRPRLTWDRADDTLTARENARRVAVINGGTIPDRGLYGVFLAGGKPGAARVGELDEEMVFESRVGEVFLLGASSWRIEEITHDRVLVSPAPGQPGKMPFWHGDQAGRPLELGRAIGRLVREIRALPAAAAIERLTRDHDLDRQAAENLWQYLADQAAAAHAVPDDRTILIERCKDELGDWRVLLLSPLGGRVHAPWSMAVVAKARDETGIDVETMWTDDGFVVRFPDVEAPPDPALLVPSIEEVEALVLRQLGSTALFAGKFREIAARALLLPKRRPGARTPLWQQRKRAADLLAVAARFGSFPVLLETYRECLRDLFDTAALVETLRQISRRQVRVVTLDSQTPSPFAASLLFGYVANYIYEGDAPLAERRAQALSVDQAQLRELIGEVELRELLDGGALEEIERRLQHLDERYRVKSADALHDLLLGLGDLSDQEIARRSATLAVAQSIRELVRARRALAITAGGEPRYIAVEDASRYRDALGIPLPPDIPEALLEPVRDPLGDLGRRFARTRGPFTTEEFAARYLLAQDEAEAVLARLRRSGRLIQGEFRPGGMGREWCDSDVLGSVRRRSLAKLRHEVEPVDASALGRFVTSWHGLSQRRSGADALLDAIEQLQGAALPASILETEILPARIENYQPADLDLLAAAGEVVWTGVEALGERDGRIALYLTDHLPSLARPPTPDQHERREQRIVDHLRERGASFFAEIHQAAGGGYPGETVDAIWNLVWRGVLTNDMFQPLRAIARPRVVRRRKPSPGAARFRSRRQAPPTAEGRWSLVESRLTKRPTPTEWSAAVARQLLARHGVLTREAVAAEALPGGFSAVYDVLKAMEESGKIRRGYFVAGLGATQFALPAAVDRLRAHRDEPEEPQTVHLAATDPANPYGTMLKWPADAAGKAGALARGPIRSVGASLILVNGAVAAYLGKGDRQLLVYLPEDEPRRSLVAREVARKLGELANQDANGRRGMLIADVNGTRATEHPIADHLVHAGFVATAMGFQARRRE